MKHSVIAPGFIHTPFNWVYATAADRVAARFDPADELKAALDLNTGDAWVLTAVDGTGVGTWKGLGRDLPTLDGIPAPAANVSLNGHKITGLADATAATDALNRETGDARYDATGAAAVAQAAAQAASAQGLVPTAVKNGAYAPAAGEFVPIDISTGNVPLTLPTAPPDKTRIGAKVVKVSGTPGSTSGTIARGGADVFNIAGGSTVLTLSALFQGVLLQYKASSGIWYVSTADTPLGVPLGAAKTGTDNTVGGPGGTGLAPSVVTDSWLDLVKQFGAKGDGKIVTDGAITGGQATLTSAQAAFTNADVGKSILVSRAGAAGPIHLVTTILSVAGGVATLNANATNTVANAYVIYGTDDTAAIQAAIDQCWLNGGGTIYGGDKTFIVAGALKALATSGPDKATWGYRAQLALPAAFYGTNPTVPIRFLGKSPMNTAGAIYSVAGGSATPVGFPAGFTIASLLVGQTYSGVTGWPSLLGGPDDTLLTGTHFSAVRCILENMVLLAPENPSVLVAQFSKISSAAAIRSRITALTMTGATTEPQPTNLSGRGIHFPQDLASTPHTIDGLQVTSFYAAVRTGEHLESRGCVIARCYVGLDVSINNNHTIRGDFDIEECPYIVAGAPAGGEATASTGPLDIRVDTETNPAATPAWVSRAKLVDAVPNNAGGRIAFYDQINTGAIPWAGSIASGPLQFAIYDLAFPLYKIGAAAINGSAPPAFGAHWQNVGGANDRPAGFWVDDSGVVHLVGLVTPNASPVGFPIFTLPAWWIPPGGHTYFTDAPYYNSDPGVAGTYQGRTPVAITSAGAIFAGACPIGDVMSLDGIEFPTAVAG